VSTALLSLYSGECHSFSQSPPSPPLLVALLARFGVRCLWVWSAHLLPSPPSPPLSAVLPARFRVRRLGLFLLVCDARVWCATASSFPVPQVPVFLALLSCSPSPGRILAVPHPTRVPVTTPISSSGSTRTSTSLSSLRSRPPSRHRPALSIVPVQSRARS